MDLKGAGGGRPRSVAETRIVGPWLRRNILRIALVLLADFMLVRVWGPQLINRHDDAALAGGVLCFTLALAATLWLATVVLADFRHLRRARRLAAPRPFDRSDLP